MNIKCQYRISDHGHIFRSRFWEWCNKSATWRVRGHSFGNVTFDHYYCEEHYQQNISKYKLDYEKDVVRL